MAHDDFTQMEASEIATSHNIRIEYMAETDSSLKANRELLRTKPGIIVSNHPGYYDVPIIVSAAHRANCQVLVSEYLYPHLVAAYGEEHVATADPRKTVSSFRKQLRYIRSDGVVITFPGGNVVSDGEIVFKRGLSLLIRNLRPDDMVYSFHFSTPPGDEREEASKKQISVIVRERYSEAAEWQRLMRECSRETTCRTLTRKYLSLFEGLWSTRALVVG